MVTPEPPGLPPAGWSSRERVALAGLCFVLLALFVLRVQTRRPDEARVPVRPDVLVLHIAALRADAVSAEAWASDLGLDAPAVLQFPEAFAQSTNPARSALSALRGELALDLAQAPGPNSLAPMLGAAGYRTLLFADDPELIRTAGGGFDECTTAPAPGALAAEASHRGPLFAFVHLDAPANPLQAATTDADALRAAYGPIVEERRGVVARAAQAWASRDRPVLIALIGASGAALGEHPDRPDWPWEPALRVPFVLGLRDGSGLPRGVHRTPVSSADLGPTILDLLDLRDVADRARDGVTRDGTSLKPLVHGWASAPVHQHLILLGDRHGVVRAPAWKILAPLEAGRPVRAGARLHALAEDPQEQIDLLGPRPFGPVAEELFGVLADRLVGPSREALR